MSYSAHFDPKTIPDLTGKVALVTGANVGIGLATVEFLARNNATVYLSARNEQKANTAIDGLRTKLKESGIDNKIYFHHLDLADLKGAKASAEGFMKKETRLDILVCNAGTLGIKWTEEYDYEPHMLINHFGHFVFVNTLLPLIEKTGAETKDARVVIVSSYGYKMAKDNTIVYESITNKPTAENMAVKRKLGDYSSAFALYCQTKLANIWFANELDRRLREKHAGASGVWVNAVHPGMVGSTGLGEEMEDMVPMWLARIILFFMAMFALTPSQGASSQTYLATSPEIVEQNVHGQFYRPYSWLGFIFRGVTHHKIEDVYMNPDDWKKFWEFTEDIVAKELAK